MLQDLVNKDIVVRLKWGETEYKGRLVSVDSYMNVQLTNAQEFVDQKFTSDLGQILIRCVPNPCFPSPALLPRDPPSLASSRRWVDGWMEWMEWMGGGGCLGLNFFLDSNTHTLSLSL